MLGGVPGGGVPLPLLTKVQPQSLLRTSGAIKPLSINELLTPRKVSASDAVSVASLEKHIHDVRGGKGYLSSQTGKEIGRLDRLNGSRLVRSDPGLTTLYGATLSGLSGYGQRSRFINSVGELSTMLDRLDRAQQLKGREEEVMELFGYDPETGKRRTGEQSADTGEHEVPYQPAKPIVISPGAVVSRYQANAEVVGSL